MLKRLLSWFVGMGIVLCFSSPVLADKSVQEEITELKQRISALEEKINKQGEKIDTQEELNKSLSEIKDALKDISVSAGATFVMQGTHNANGDGLSKNGEDVTDASYSVDLEIEKKFSDYGKAYLHFEGGSGDGVTDELQVFSNVNADATGDENFDLIEAWYEQYFKSIPLTLTFGKLDPTCYLDTNEYANDETSQFLGDAFKNAPTIEFPDDNGPGVRFLLSPFKWLDVETLVMDADSDWENFFDDVFFAGQFDFKPNLFSRQGNYRVYGWLNNKDHTKWSEPSSTKENGYGFGLSFDQELTDDLGIFARYGWQDPEVYANGADFSLEQFYSIGVQISGNRWNRNDDVFAVAFGQIFPSDDYKKADNRKADSEKHLEAYYSFKVNDHLAVSPDIQVIWDPYGGDAANGDKTIVVGGLRAQVDF